jgi:adenylate kinase
VSDSPYKSILLFGAPGTGKGTQGAILANIPGFAHLSTGDMFRGLDKESDLGKEFLKYSTQGLLVPDDFTIRLWSDHVRGLIDAGHYAPTKQFLMLDGIPRTAEQATAMDGKIEVHAVIHLTCADREQLVQRLIARAAKSGRPDDAKEDVVRKRLEVYDDETKPVLDHYDAGLIHDIEATGTPAEVLQRILAVLAPLQAGVMGNALA